MAEQPGDWSAKTAVSTFERVENPFIDRFTSVRVLIAQVNQTFPKACYGISEQTLYRWKAKFGGLALSDEKRLKQYAASFGSGVGRQRASGVSMGSIRTPCSNAVRQFAAFRRLRQAC
jgi:hypothetical protein